MGTLSGALFYSRIIYAFLHFVNRVFTKNYKINYKIISACFRFNLIFRLFLLLCVFYAIRKCHFPNIFMIIKIFITCSHPCHFSGIGFIFRLQMVTSAFSGNKLERVASLPPPVGAARMSPVTPDFRKHPDERHAPFRGRLEVDPAHKHPEGVLCAAGGYDPPLRGVVRLQRQSRQRVTASRLS